MSTISLFASQVNQFPGLVKGISNKVSNFKTELTSIRNKSLNIDKSICNLDEIIDSVKSATDTQDDKVEMLDTLSADCEQFILDTVAIDDDVEDIINESKDDFYDEYYFLKPECEKNPFEKIKGGFKNLCQWCKAHWKQILITIAVVVGTVLAVVAVIASGGMALVPLLTGAMTALGVSSGVAMTVATIVSLAVATIAVVSSVASGIMNFMTIWNINGVAQNPTFQKWKKIVGVVSAVSNVMYSVGSIYCGIKGITNQSLRTYSKNWILNKDGFRSAVWGAKNYNTLSFVTDKSLFWAGLDKNGANVSSAYANEVGKQTLGQTIKDAKMAMPGDNAWNAPSAAMAMKSSGNAEALLGKEFAGKFLAKEATEYGKIWTNTESVLLNINPAVRSITISSMDNLGNITSQVINKMTNFSISNFSFTFTVPNLIEGLN